MPFKMLTNREFRRFSYRVCTRLFGYLASYVWYFLVCEFGSFDNVLRDAGIRAIPI